MGLAGGKRCGGRRGGGGEGAGGRDGGSDGTHLMPPHPVFSRASGYLLIGYSKISETRRYRRKKRGDAREDERIGGRGKEDERSGKEEGWEREGTGGGRVVADRTRRWGLTTTTPQRRGFLFVPREFLFVSFPVARPHPPAVRELRFLRSPLPPWLALSSSTSSYSSSYHRPPKIRVRYYLSPDRSRSATPANVLFRRLAPRHGPPTITGPRTI